MLVSVHIAAVVTMYFSHICLPTPNTRTDNNTACS